jgi:predicted RNA binding protein YcfA (HicA-like mRNA interferase family)
MAIENVRQTRNSFVTVSATLSDSRPMHVKQVLRMPHDDGWTEVARRGSHRQFKHKHKPGRVTVAGKPSDDLAPGTLNSILKQARLKSE